jgi:WXG100 family type VII secretion target
MGGGGLGGFNTDVDVMDAAAQKVRAVNQDIQGKLKTLKGQVQQTRGEWKGPAAVKFESMMEAWDRDAQQLNQALEGIAVKMGTNRKLYADAETAVGGALGKIESRLS